MNRDGAGQTASRHVALGLACAIWGSAFLFAKIALGTLPVSHVALGRFALASAILAPIALARGSLPRAHDVPLFALTGVLGVPATFLLQFEGLARTTVTSASLIVGAGVPLMALAAFVFQDDRLEPRGWVATALSTLGVGLMIGVPGPGRTAAGDALVFLSMIVVVGYVLLSTRLLERYDAIGTTAWSLTLGTLVLAPLAWLLDGSPFATGVPTSANASVIVLGVGCTALTYLLWNWGLAGVRAARASVYLNLEPLVGATLGVLFLGDRLSPLAVLGGLLILGAAYAISRRERASAVAPPGTQATHWGGPNDPREEFS